MRIQLVYQDDTFHRDLPVLADPILDPVVCFIQTSEQVGGQSKHAPIAVAEIRHRGIGAIGSIEEGAVRANPKV
ncbi:hypothetical protein [Candidatus Amarobacter glycogenicus]|uniref:hypothetical protein n=1 Tax=Candidatus Amarobacter glycogenicus TaxID=3140699 RepID=UPI0031CC70D2